MATQTIAARCILDAFLHPERGTLSNVHKWQSSILQEAAANDWSATLPSQQMSGCWKKYRSGRKRWNCSAEMVACRHPHGAYMHASHPFNWLPRNTRAGRRELTLSSSSSSQARCIYRMPCLTEEHRPPDLNKPTQASPDWWHQCSRGSAAMLHVFLLCPSLSSFNDILI